MSAARRAALLCALAMLAPGAAPLAAQQRPPVRILVYTKNGQGYVHENIPAAIRAFQRLGPENGMTVDTSTDPAVFTDANLRRYALLVFASTNNDVFDSDAQRLAFRRYIEAGGGLVGLHSVTGTERNWTWFKQMLGGTFNWHAPFQSYRLRRMDRGHPSMQDVPDTWQKEDECYFLKEMYPGIHVLLASEIHSLAPADSQRIREASAPFADYYPAAWAQAFDGGTIWITALGHDARDYEDPTFLRHVQGGLRWVAAQARPLDYTRAYATTRDTPLR